MNPKLLADGHVHFHACFAWDAFLTAAAANFALARRTLGLGTDSPGCLMFTEIAGVHAFRELRNSPETARSIGWQLSRVDEEHSVRLVRDDGETLMVVAGRQIVTSERLEVLALGCPAELSGRHTIRAVLRFVAERNGVAVIPWGLGKWWGPRGRVVRDLIDAPRDVPFCLGDNGGRGGPLPSPALFRRAAGRGVPVLGGSDPLPLASHVSRPGSYGFVLDDWCDTRTPAAAITARLRALTASPASFGARSSFPEMVRAQVGIRWRRNADPRR